jgi:Family of unknown function (DUF6335)
MAKRNAGKQARSRGAARKRAPARRLDKRSAGKGKKLITRPASDGRARATEKTGRARATAKTGSARAMAKKSIRPATPAKKVALRRQAVKRQRSRPGRAVEPVTVPGPPSSLNMHRRGSAARTGRSEMHESQEEHRGMSPEITAGDVDVDVEDAYFTGDEAPGGDNPTPDQDVVDDIGKALGVEYQDAEELKAGDKVVERDRHRWELDPASSEDYKDRK